MALVMEEGWATLLTFVRVMMRGSGYLPTMVGAYLLAYSLAYDHYAFW